MNIDVTSRAVGILSTRGRVIIRACPETEDRTVITIGMDTAVGAIVRNPETGRWSYDDVMRPALGITENPDFATDVEAGRDIQDYLPSAEQLNAFAGDAPGRPA